MFNQAYHIFFAPTGQPVVTGSVWSNMVAWVICGFIAIIWGRRKFIKWDNKRKEHAESLHEDMKQHITNEHAKSRAHLEQLTRKRG